MRGIHRWPVNSPHKGPVTRKMFPFDDVIMTVLGAFPHKVPVIHAQWYDVIHGMSIIGIPENIHIHFCLFYSVWLYHKSLWFHVINLAISLGFDSLASEQSRDYVGAGEVILKDVAKIDSWWRNQMETFSALLALCAGNLPVTGEFPSQRPVTRSFGVFVDLHLE